MWSRESKDRQTQLESQLELTQVGILDSLSGTMVKTCPGVPTDTFAEYPISTPAEYRSSIGALPPSTLR